jgi:hypothetical protein
MSEETIRTSMTKVLQDANAPAGVRELALEVLHWRLRDRLPATDMAGTPDLVPNSVA